MKPVDPEFLKKRMTEHAKQHNSESFRNLWRSFKAVFSNGLDYSQGNPLQGLWQHGVRIHQEFQSRRRSRCASRRSHHSTCNSFWHARNEDISPRI